MNENINLCEILKDCQKGTKFFSYIHGEVEFHSIDLSLSHPIIVEAKAKAGYIRTKTFSKGGFFDDGFNCICTLVPSLEQPDWSKWQCPKPKFDPKTLMVFDKVLVWHTVSKIWLPDFYSFCDNNGFTTIGGGFYNIIIPYNEETKHLVGTSDEAPEYYRYREIKL